GGCALCSALSVSFFFQAEDGIRDWSVTGVQTCALPIWVRDVAGGERLRPLPRAPARALLRRRASRPRPGRRLRGAARRAARGDQIGRASCRERGAIAQITRAVKTDSVERDEGAGV